MNWKLKAKIQNLISLLPSDLSYELYYQIQRRFGNLRSFNPIVGLTSGVETWKRLKLNGFQPIDTTFYEIGTGRVPLTALSYWLMGADKVITVDKNPYLKQELLLDSLEYIYKNQQEIKSIFEKSLIEDRFSELISFSSTPGWQMMDFLNQFQIVYKAPGDASNTDLPDKSVDFVTSFWVFEHIPAEILTKIINESNRILSDKGAAIHNIDYRDHFIHADPTISSINFLQYSDKEWSKFAGNRYMYMNRLRHDDYIELIRNNGQKLLSEEVLIDHGIEITLSSKNFVLDSRFAEKSIDVLTAGGAWIISKPV